MPGAGITIDVHLEEGGDAQAALRRMAESLDDAREVLEDIGRRLVASTVRRFERTAGPDGRPWPTSIRAREEGGLTLTDTGRLRGSITHQVLPRAVRVGTNVPYAATHQFGAEIRPRRARALKFRVAGQWATKQSVSVPARPFLGVSRDDEAEIARIVEDGLRRAAA